jgi:hypothetical protein
MIKYCEIVKTVDLQPIQTIIGDDLKFRIEILRDHSSGEFSAILWRIENYRVQPTFPQADGVPTSILADEEILVKDISTLSDTKSPAAELALQLALKTIAEKFI